MPEEQSQLDTFERLGSLLDIVHSSARRAEEKAQEGWGRFALSAISIGRR